jgi:hypothetical protein
VAWAPLLVLLSALTVRWGVDGGVPATGAWLAAIVGALAAALYLGLAAATHEGRRRIAGAWLRATRWEFWPPWVFYPPIVAWIVLLGTRHRSLALFTAANPVMPAGGFVGESKTDILRGLVDGGAPAAPFIPLTAASARESRRARAAEFAARHGLPLVLKPDNGQRGTGVQVLRSLEALGAAVGALERDAILQAYVPGVEFGLFYARRPSEARGRVISVTEKRFPDVMGDGRRTLRALIADDARAVALARVYGVINRARLDEVPASGEQVRIAELGSHCRGAIFLDGAAQLTPALEDAVEAASRALPGFSFGRFDVRAESVEALREGRFAILELNGVTSEPTHIYDPAHGLLSAWRTVARAWTLAFAIGAEHARLGARVWSVRELAALAFDYRRGARRQPSPVSETSRALDSSNPA